MATILTIDDDINVRRTLSKGLSALGRGVLEASGGKAGLRMAFWRKVDLILLDISMPDMNGLNVLRALKEARRTQHIPVIMLTGLDDPELRDQAQFDYAENYIVKNTSITQINEKLNQVLALKPKLPRGWPTILRW